MRTTEHVMVPKMIVTCDYCGKEPGRIRKCYLCEKDVCQSCAVLTDLSDLVNGGFDCDYPEYICRPCWDKGATIRALIMASRNVRQKEEDELMAKWKSLIKKED